MKTTRARIGWPKLCLFAAILIGGCATEVGHKTFLTHPYPAKQESFQVEVFTNGLPSKAFERVAILDAHCESQGFMVPNLQNDGLPMLMKQAREAGCDAIIEITEVKLSTNWTFETKTKHFSAVGIVYKP